MEVSYKRDMNHTYMICRGEHPVDTSAYPVRMMLSNQWKAFLPCRIQGMDNQIFFTMILHPGSLSPVFPVQENWIICN